MTHTTLLSLSRWQWALIAAFHITFPAITVGTSVPLIICYAMSDLEEQRSREVSGDAYRLRRRCSAILRSCYSTRQPRAWTPRLAPGCLP